MSLARQAAEDLTVARDRFLLSTRNLTEAMSAFVLSEGTMSTAQQVAHTSRVIDWLLEGAFRPQGFALDFDEQIKSVLAVQSLSAARAWFTRSMAEAIQTVAGQSDSDLLVLLPPGPILGNMARIGIIREITDHTAHHRGALTGYARLNGIAAPDPYGL